MFCEDPYISFLKDRGYNVIRLPKADFPPLTLLSHSGERDLSRIGNISELFVGATLPVIAANVPAAGVSGKHTNALNLGLGLDLLGTIISAMGGGQIGLKTEFKHASGVTFEFPHVLSDGVTVAALDKFLGATQISADVRYVRELLDNSDIYVVTNTIKSDSVTVDTNASGSAGVEVQVPALQQIVGATVKVSGESEHTGRVTFSGDAHLVFGFQAYRLIYADGKYIKLEPLPAGSSAAKSVDGLLTGQPPETAVRLHTKGAWVTFNTN